MLNVEMSGNGIETQNGWISKMVLGVYLYIGKYGIYVPRRMFIKKEKI